MFRDKGLTAWCGQSPVSRLCSLAASSDPSFLRSTSFKPTEPMTDAREPEQAVTWRSSTGSVTKTNKQSVSYSLPCKGCQPPTQHLFQPLT